MEKGEQPTDFRGKEGFEGDVWTLDSKESVVVDAADEVAQRLADLGWPEDEITGFQMAVNEAVANAVLHGNKKDESKKVTVRMELTPEEATVTVEDEGGATVQVNEVPDPTADENLLKASGRGILLMQKFCDSVDFYPGKVVLTKLNKTKPA